ncbi:MAG: malto-oligosyltrehalose trehalohydrolase, partial [Phycisphaerae bacterium]|nr:malto-oligosyltrehalose trehalohydrolase [Phycisphaerae bacterium]
ARAGTRYRFRLGGTGNPLPDPASRCQPDGVHGSSEVIDPNKFKWTDQGWRGIDSHAQVLYELHVGTFTPEGTWAAATEQLPELKSLGITCIEMMPVAEFQGEFGWGYDGVDLFAPTRLYGNPDDLRRFIDTAHGLGLAVILDVVYNHLGPAGNYLPSFSKTVFSEIHKNDWGQQLNFDGDGSVGVREFLVTNARYWIREFHFDGFRFDATQAIVDTSDRHILRDITEAARKEAGDRSIYLISENEPQHTKIVRPPNKGGYGMDALWNDDFHHSANVAMIGHNEAYLTDYLGHASEFIAACKWGYLYQGQIYAWQKKRRGTPALDLPFTAFVNYIQNHDQIANYAHGQRVHELSGLPLFRAMTALLLLAPQTPLLFQGEEFASSSSFNFFADHDEELNGLIRKGRKKELSQFPSVAQPDMMAALPDPTDRRTFERCKLKFSERQQGYHGRIYRMHKDLLRLRQTDPIFSRRDKSHAEVDGAALTESAFFLRYFDSGGNNDDRIIAVNLGNDLILSRLPQPLLAPPSDMIWETMWCSEHASYGGTGCPPFESRGESWRAAGEYWRIPGRCAIVLRPIPAPTETSV